MRSLVISCLSLMIPLSAMAKCPKFEGKWECQGEIPTLNDIVEIRQESTMDGLTKYTIPYRSDDPQDYYHNARLASGKAITRELTREGKVETTTTCTSDTVLTDVFDAPDIHAEVRTTYTLSGDSLRVEKSQQHLGTTLNQISTCKKR